MKMSLESSSISLSFFYHHDTKIWGFVPAPSFNPSMTAIRYFGNIKKSLRLGTPPVRPADWLLGRQAGQTLSGSLAGGSGWLGARSTAPAAG